MQTRAERAARIRQIYLSLPGTKETLTWGAPHFRVGEKIFGGLDEADGRTSIGFKLELAEAAALVRSDPRVTKAPYVGHKGWVNLDVSEVEDWEQVRKFVETSYRLIAPKRLVASLGGSAATSAQPKPARKPAPRAKR